MSYENVHRPTVDHRDNDGVTLVVGRSVAIGQRDRACAGRRRHRDGHRTSAGGALRSRAHEMRVRRGMRRRVAQLLRQMRPADPGRFDQVPRTVLVRAGLAHHHHQGQINDGREYDIHNSIIDRSVADFVFSLNRQTSTLRTTYMICAYRNDIENEIITRNELNETKKWGREMKEKRSDS